jgi:AraC-like DNA-binding protein/mannose-6-phosphate isomerase-like protein (cupin superfamily)
MALMRHGEILREYDPGRGVSVAALTYDYPVGYEVPKHAHGSDQLLYATHGVMEVSSEQNIWLVPPQFALWIPAKTGHRIRMCGAVSMRTLYLRPGLVSRTSPGSSVLHVTPLLRELIIEAVRLGRLRIKNRHECALRDLITLHVAQASSAPIFVVMPGESRAARVAQAIFKDPGGARSLACLCSDAGVSIRTLQRIFLREVGTDPDSWRRQVRLTRAVNLLVSGSSVKEASVTVGYRQPSGFVAAFRRLFGSTPRAWIAVLKREAGRTPHPII